jgi:hypothetical protein
MNQKSPRISSDKNFINEKRTISNYKNLKNDEPYIDIDLLKGFSF